MRLIIDEGNTSVKLAVYQQDNMVEYCIVIVDELSVKITELYQTYKIQAVIVSSVSTYAYPLVKKMGLSNVYFLSFDLPIPFQNLYETPRTLGVDRIALVAAAVFNFPNSNVLIVDAGTCITYDFVDEHQKYYGGAISPGLQMRFKAMHDYTAKLPLVTITDGLTSFIGRNTYQSLEIGVVFGVANEIDGFVKLYHEAYKNLQVVITGGDAINLCKQLKSTIFVRPNFLLEGLNRLLTYQLENEI